MPIKYDRHARKRMKDREVGEIEIEFTLKNPDFSMPSVKGRKNVFKFLNGRYLRVTFKENVDHILIITVTIRKNPFRG